MERFQEAREKAKRNLQIADHMIYMTYSVVKDPKLLLVIMENIFLALTNAMSSVLYYESYFKRLSPFPENFESKFSLFQDCCVRKYNIDKSFVSLIREVKDFIFEHRRSSVEFVRKDRFVICTDNYQMKAVSVDQIKRYISQAKIFLQDTSRIVQREERVMQ